MIPAQLEGKNIFEIFDKKWALVTAGTPESFNTMTISWGGLGTLWNMPAATVYVRPSRYTHQFMDRERYFTVSFFGEEHRRALGLLGSKSGRDCDKIGMTELTPVTIEGGGEVTMGFGQAELTLVCRKVFSQDMEVSAIDPETYGAHYDEGEAPHTMYVGEVVAVLSGADAAR